MLRMTNNSRLIALWYEILGHTKGLERRILPHETLVKPDADRVAPNLEDIALKLPKNFFAKTLSG